MKYRKDQEARKERKRERETVDLKEEEEMERVGRRGDKEGDKRCSGTERGRLRNKNQKRRGRTFRDGPGSVVVKRRTEN